MKKLKKFNENWIDDETEDTNRRMAELDNEEDIQLDANNEDNLNQLLEDMAEEVDVILQKYYTRIIQNNPEYDLNDVIGFLAAGLKNL
jgi:ABC-type uncharacterized transport system substrate-binding protein